VIDQSSSNTNALLVLRHNGSDVMTVSSNGDVVFAPFNNSTSAIKMQDASGNALFKLNTTTPTITLFGDVAGGILVTDIAGTKTSNAVCHSGGSGVAENVQIVACTGSIVADYAEKYPVAAGTSYGDIVATGSTMVNTYGADSEGRADWDHVIGHVTQLVKTGAPYQSSTIGIVSDNYNAFSSGGNNIRPEDNPMPVALNGRVPVNVAPDSDPIQPGDYLTTSGTSGKAMKATAGGFVIGKALEVWTPGSGASQVMVFVEPGYWPGPSTGDSLQNGGSATLSSLNVTGDTHMVDLNVSGRATLQELTVAGSVSVGGTLSVTGSAQFAGNITVGGHIITAGGQPTSVAQAAAGGSASVAVDGTDTAGTITITTGSAPTSGDLAKIIFSQVYGKAPRVVLSPSNGAASGLHFYRGATSATDFMFSAADAPAANTTYTFDYFIAQ
jgi:hypothetical protein